MQFTDLKFLMKSLHFNIIADIDFMSRRWTYTEKFVAIFAPNVVSMAPDYLPPEKEEKTRGRKPKNKINKKKMKSNITFIRRLYIHREIKKDKYNKTACKCTEHTNCEIIKKDYSIVIFQNYKGICTGIIHQDNSDFILCINDLLDLLAEYAIEKYYLFELPTSFYKYYYNSIRNSYRIENLQSTIENYQCNLIADKEKHINLHNLKSFFIGKSKDIININYNKLFDFLTRLIIDNKYEFDIDNTIINLDDKNEKNHKVSIKKLVSILEDIDLKSTELSFLQDFWLKYKKKILCKFPDYFEKNIYYLYLKNYIVYKLSYIRKSLEILDYYLVDKIRFMYDKNTLIIKKNDITTRIFNTGIINIQGAKSRESALQIQDDLLKIFKDCEEQIIYIPDKPPMTPFENILKGIF